MEIAYKTGDKVVEVDKVYRIFKIATEQRSGGEKEKIVYFRPYYKTAENSTLICSIPEKSIDQDTFRKPITKKELKELYSRLKVSKKKVAEYPDITEIHDLIDSTEHEDTIEALQLLAYQIEKEEDCAKSRRDAFQKGIDSLVQEFAFVEGVTPDKARVKIEGALQA